MKRHLLHLATILLAGAGLVMASCSDSKTDDGGTLPTPNFPEKITKTVAAGSTCEIEIDPNQDWEISIPTTADVAPYFWIQDGSQQSYKIRGNAGKATVTVGVSELEEFDQSRSCEVTMTMGGMQRVIAVITRGTVERQLNLYTCQLEEGDFAYNPNSSETGLSYLYNEAPATTIDLIWPEGRSGFMFPIMIEANFDWQLAEKPDWVASMAISSGKAGEKIEILLMSDKTKYPLDGDSGKFILQDKTNAEAAYEFGISIPACRDMFKVSGFSAESKFNYKGEYFNAMNGDWVPGSAMGSITGIEGSKVYVFSLVEQQWGDSYLSAETEDTAWIILEEEAWDASSEGGVVQDRSLNIGVKENTGEARTGMVVALPATVAETISDPYQLVDQDIREEFAQYVVTTIKQAGTPGSIMAVNPEGMAEIGTSFEKLAAGNWLLNQFGVNDAYQLTYTKAWSNDPEATLAVTDADKPYTGYKCYDYDLNEMTSAASWLTVRKTSEGFIIDMDPDKDPTGASSMGNEGIAHMGFIVFTNADGDFAVIQCVYDENIQIGGGDGEFTVAFSYPDYVSDATLVHITSENVEQMAAKYPALESDFYEQLGMGVPIYMLSYTSASPNTATLKTSAPFANVMVMPMEGADWLTYEPMGDTELMVYMEKPTDSQEQRGMIQLLDNGWNFKAIIFCDPAF